MVKAMLLIYYRYTSC